MEPPTNLHRHESRIEILDAYEVYYLSREQLVDLLERVRLRRRRIV